MVYKLVISEYADELLNNLVYYLIYRKKTSRLRDVCWMAQMDYVVIFDIREKNCKCSGVFHQLENYQSKL